MKRGLLDKRPTAARSRLPTQPHGHLDNEIQDLVGRPECQRTKTRRNALHCACAKRVVDAARKASWAASTDVVRGKDGAWRRLDGIDDGREHQALIGRVVGELLAELLLEGHGFIAAPELSAGSREGPASVSYTHLRAHETRHD